MSEGEKPASPRWSNSTKLIITLIIVVAVIALLIRFQFMLAPLIFAFILAYLLQPAAAWLHRKLKISWKFGVNLIYLVFVIVIIGLLIWGGLALLDQIQRLIVFLQNTSSTLPTTIQDFLQHPVVIGKTIIDLTKIDFLPAVQQLLSSVEPLLRQIANMVGSLASGAANVIVWLLFSILISYFILHEAGDRSGALFHLDMPRYAEDLKKIGHEVGSIWNAFLRRQVLIFFLTIAVYNIFLGVMGVKYFFGLALLAGLARFVPYIGPLIAWTTYGLVASFQGTTIFGMTPFGYAILIIVLAIVIDDIIDLFITPRLMADALKLHPGAVMVAALIGLNLFGIIGMILASPLLATLTLLYDYSRHKIQDEDPWDHIQLLQKTKPEHRLFNRIRTRIKRIWENLREELSNLQKKSKNRKEEKNHG